jgi:AcrR family transcriptional regulator
MSTRQREPTEIRQRQITEAALRMIGEKGIHGATTAGIAAEVGISEGTIYRHFKGKEDILRSVIGRIGEDLLQILVKVQGRADPLERLGELFRRHLAYAANNRGIPRTIFSEEVMVTNDVLRDDIRDKLASYLAGVRETIAEGQKTGRVRGDIDPAALTTMFIGTINFTIVRWVLSGFVLDMGKEGVTLWENFARSVAVEE